MKSLAGANPDAKPDYRAQALNDLNKLEQKVILLNEMLDNVDRERGERFVSGDAYDVSLFLRSSKQMLMEPTPAAKQQVSSILRSARPKIQKWINDAENDDSESLDTFLQINDQINTVLARYEAFKKGDYTAAANPIPAELSNNSRTQQESLIDFDDEPPTSNTGAGTGGISDLAGLFATPAPPAVSQQQAFSSPPITTHSPVPTTAYNANNGFGGLQLGGGTSSPFQYQQPQQSTTPPAAIRLPTSPTPQQSSTPVQTPPSMFGGVSAGMMNSQRKLSQPQPQPQQQQQNKDPFADLAGLF